jgi:hypothetical protein
MGSPIGSLCNTQEERGLQHELWLEDQWSIKKITDPLFSTKLSNVAKIWQSLKHKRPFGLVLYLPVTRGKRSALGQKASYCVGSLQFTKQYIFLGYFLFQGNVVILYNSHLCVCVCVCVRG